MCSPSCFLYRYYSAKSRIIGDHEAVFEHFLPFDWFLYDKISVMKELNAFSCSSTIRRWNATLKILKMSIVLEYWNYFDAVTVINYVMILVTLVNRSRFKCFYIICKKKMTKFLHVTYVCQANLPSRKLHVQVNKRNTRTSGEIYSELTMKTPMALFWCLYC